MLIDWIGICPALSTLHIVMKPAVCCVIIMHRSSQLLFVQLGPSILMGTSAWRLLRGGGGGGGVITLQWTSVPSAVGSNAPRRFMLQKLS